MTRYPKPGETGGKLIREVIQFLRSHGGHLPITSDILIAVSGGSDSVALAHLLIHFGRRVGLKKHFRILHINHSWRGEESNSDAQFVRELAKKWGVLASVRKLKVNTQSGRSWEEFAREERKRIFEEECQKRGAVVFTAHQADDLAETMVWRLFTGAMSTHGEGIRVLSDREVRPFLRTRKQTIIQYLREENINWREDRTNHEGRFLRSKMRLLLMPAIESIFPRAIEHLVKLGLGGQTRVSPSGEILSVAARVIDERLKRAHWDVLKKNLERDPFWKGEIQLPGEWKLRREMLRKSPRERWVLEKT